MTPETVPVAYEFYDHWIEPRPVAIETTGAAVLVNSVGRKATFRRGKIAKAILTAAGEGVRQELDAHVPLVPGQIVITSAGHLRKTALTRYIFHAVVTSGENRYYADPKLISQSTARAVHLADLLGQPSIAIPALGSGVGRGDPLEVVRRIVGEIIALLPKCMALRKVIFATTSPETYQLFHQRALAAMALAYSEQELKNSLASFPPALYGLVGDLLQKFVAARQAGDSAQAETLQQEARGLKYLAEQLQGELPAANQDASRVVQVVVHNSLTIIHHIDQQNNIGAGGVLVEGSVGGDIVTGTKITT
jgi:O-acetyl-ADP-ribose deacetylase (regulator of RNase III)